MPVNNATQGDDTFINTADSDTFDGLQGTDTVLYSGYSYADGMVTVKDTGNLKTTVDINGIIDNLKWVEWLQFDNGKYDVANKTFVPNPLPTLSIADASVNEEAGTITFTVTLSAAASGPVTFTYSTADGTAGSADYVGVSNQLATIAAGQTSTTITIALINDNIVETGGETFFVNLSSPVGATIADGQAVGTILEQDQLIVGTTGNDDGISNPLLVGGNGDDTIQGLAGDDGLIGGLGNDTLIGGAGFDRAIYTTAGAAANIQLAAGTVTIASSVDTLSGVEFVRGTAFDDVYNAAGFGPGSTNANSEGNTFNGFEGLGGEDQITGNGNTRIEYTNATAGVVVNLAGPAAGAPAGATGFASGDASVGNDTIFGGVNRVRGSAFADTITGAGTTTPGTGNEIFEGRGGNDIIDGGANGIDIALFSGPRSNYTITPGGVAGSSTVTDNVGGDGADTLTNIELTEFSNAYNLNQRVLDLSGFGALAAGKQIFGTNNNASGVGDNLTLGGNANGRFIDLADGGTDTLTLATGGTYSLNLARVEIVAGSGGNDLVTLQNGAFGMAVNLAGGADTLSLANGGNNVTVNGVETVTGGSGNDTVSVGSSIFGMSVDLGAGIDSLNLANGGNSVTVSGTESVHGGSGFDTVTLGDATPITINSIESVIGGGGNDQITINADAGVTSVTASLNLDGGNDTVNLNFFGLSTVANLGLTGVDHLTSAGGVQTVNLSNDTGLATVDLGGGFHTLNLAPADHNLSVSNVFTLNSAGTHNDTINFETGPGVNQTIDLGFGNDVLNFTGANDHLSMTIKGALLVHDQTTSGNLELNLLNQQAGSTYDLGAGTDTLHLNGNTGFVNVVSVQNVENVDSTGFGSDQIHILGNAGGTTTVTAGGGADLLWASADADHFRFTSTGDSPNDMPFGGQRDVIHDFDAGADAFVFDHIAGLNPAQFTWTEVNFGGTDILLVDIDGGGVNNGTTYPGYEMAIQLEDHVGTLTSANFILLT